jgi:MYXO-CTERM domain-containing protein
MLNIHFTPIAGDYNADGLIDAADYVSWRKGLGTLPTETWYQVWRSKFGVGSAGGTSSAVPEPAGWLLTMLCLLLGRCRSRQR